MAQLDPQDLERVWRALGVRPSGLRWARGHGAPSNRRYDVELPSGETAFAKIAAFDHTVVALARAARELGLPPPE
jgi:hypothetical protein